MIQNAVLTFSVLSAVTLALAYHPLLRKMSFGLISPYPKADLKKRAIAAMADGSLVAAAVFYYVTRESSAYLAAGAAYLLLRDMLGRSVGKFLAGLVVIDQATGVPCGWQASIKRNILLSVPGANLVAVYLETSTIIRDTQGQRLGDRVALTQVVEGFGAKDLLTLVQQWMRDVLEQNGPQKAQRGLRPQPNRAA